MALCTTSSIWACTIFSGRATSTVPAGSPARCREFSGLDALEPLDLLAQVGVRSSMVSNSLASWANSSSASEQLALLDRDDGDGDVGVLAGVLTGDQLGEGLGLAGLQTGDGLVQALE